jgi:dUTP pyrophosphatase
MTSDLRFFKINSEVKEPIRATEGSACFDLCSFLPNDLEVKIYYNSYNEQKKTTRKVIDGEFQIYSGERVLIPTGLIFDIPTGHSVRLYPRSSIALKQGLTLANNVGIIDSDYVEPVFMMVYNISDWKQTIINGERICQAEMLKELPYIIMETDVRPEQKTDRKGGFGSTGKE